MATPTLKKEYLDMIPEYNGEPTMLSRFISICDKVVAKFFVVENPDDFQNEYLFSSILSKLKGQALEVVVNSNTYSWTEVRKILLATYLDRRDCFTLNLEMSELKQENQESPFKFYERINKLLNLQIAFFTNHENSARDVLCTYVRKLALRVLLRGLQEPLGSLMRTKDPNSLEEALNMLTNDFQFKNNKLFQNNNKPIVNKPMQIQKPVQNRFFQKQSSYQPFQSSTYHQNFQNPHFNKPSQSRQQFFNNQPKINVNQKPYKPTPMSISTKQTDNTVRNTKMYQITGKPAEEEFIEDLPNFVQNDESYVECSEPEFLQEQFKTLSLDEEDNAEGNDYFLGDTNLEINST